MTAIEDLIEQTFSEKVPVEVRRAAVLLPTCVSSEEEPLLLTIADNRGPGLLLLTDLRILFVQVNVLRRKPRIIALRRSSLTDLQLTKYGWYFVLVVNDADKRAAVRFGMLTRATGEELLAALS